jgi:hypothetical protein
MLVHKDCVSQLVEQNIFQNINRLKEKEPSVPSILYLELDENYFYLCSTNIQNIQTITNLYNELSKSFQCLNVKNFI